MCLVFTKYKSNNGAIDRGLNSVQYKYFITSSNRYITEKGYAQRTTQINF